MKIKNNRNNFVVLQIKDGSRKMIQKFNPLEVIEIPYLFDMKQVANKFLFSIGNLSVVKSNDVALEKKESKTKKTTAKKTTSKKKVAKKSKVEKAIEKADDFMNGDVEESEKVQKAKSNKNKTKKEEK